MNTPLSSNISISSFLELYILFSIPDIVFNILYSSPSISIFNTTIGLSTPLYSCACPYIHTFLPASYSVVIAVRNEIKSITTLVDQILKNKTNFEVELIVVDDGSDDGTLEYLQKLSYSNILVLQNNLEGKKSAIKLALETAKFEIVIFFDAGFGNMRSGFLTSSNTVTDGGLHALLK